MKVLLVDDDVDMLELLHYVLRREGYTVRTAIDGRQALDLWENDTPHIVLLDNNLPRVDGYEVCRQIRARSETPIIMVSARDSEADIIRGLETGADDYVTKPFSAKQLVARMRAVLRRSSGIPRRESASEVRVGDLSLDLPSQQVVKAGKPVNLTRIEFRLLLPLVLNAGCVVPYSRLVEHAWGYQGEETSGLLKSHISHIRRKLRVTLDQPGWIKAVLRVGYSLNVAPSQTVTHGGIRAFGDLDQSAKCQVPAAHQASHSPLAGGWQVNSPLYLGATESLVGYVPPQSPQPEPGGDDLGSHSASGAEEMWLSRG